MAHFARINGDNSVQEVIVVDNHNAPTEEAGQEFIASIGLNGTWKQTSYNTIKGVHYIQNPEGTTKSGKQQYRGNYACIGMVYDEEHDAFISPKPSETAVLNTTTYTWEEPVVPTAGE